MFKKPGYGKSKKLPFPGNSRNRDPGSQILVAGRFVAKFLLVEDKREQNVHETQNNLTKTKSTRYVPIFLFTRFIVSPRKHGKLKFTLHHGAEGYNILQT